MAQARDSNLKVTGVLFQKMTGWIPGGTGLTDERERWASSPKPGLFQGGVFEKSVSISAGLCGRINSIGWSLGTVSWEPVVLKASPTKRLAVCD